MRVEELIKQARTYLEGIYENCFSDSSCEEAAKITNAYNIAKADLYLDFALKKLEQRKAED